MKQKTSILEARIRKLNWSQKIILVTFLIGLIFLPISSVVTLVLTACLFASVSFLSLGIITRLLLSFFSYGVIGAIVLEVTSLIGLRPSFAVIHFSLLILATSYSISHSRTLDLRSSVQDLVAFAVGSAVFLLICLPLFGASSSKTLEYLTPGEDNNSHFELYRYLLTERKYAYNNSLDHTGIRPSLLSYAQGSHAAMAVVTSPFVEHSTRAQQLKAYVYFAAATFSATISLAYTFISKPLGTIKDRSLRRFTQILAGLLFGIFFPTSIFLSLYTYGFYPQYFAYLGLTLLLLLSTSLKLPEESSRRAITVQLSAIGLEVYAVFSSWYLLFPITLAPVLVYVWLNRKAFNKARWVTATLIGGFGIVLAYLAYVFVFTSSGANHVLTTGGVEKMRGLILTLCLPSVGLVYVSYKRKLWTDVGLGLCLVSAGIVTAFIGAYQVKKIHHFDYYFYKSLYTILLVSVLYYGYLASSYLSTALESFKPSTNDQSKYFAYWLLAGLTLVAWGVVDFNKPKYLQSFISTKYSIPQHALSRPLDIFTFDKIYGNYSDVITLNYCNEYTNFTGSIWAGAYFLPYNQQRGDIEGRLITDNGLALSDPKNNLSKEIIAYSTTKTKPVGLVVGSSCLNVELAKSIFAHTNVKLIYPNGQLVSS